jgi:hypothetical protein
MPVLNKHQLIATGNGGLGSVNMDSKRCLSWASSLRISNTFLVSWLTLCPS